MNEQTGLTLEDFQAARELLNKPRRNQTPPANPERMKETPYQKHLRELRVKRYNEIIATIPPGLPREWEGACKRYAYICAQNLGKRGLARVVWPWNKRPQPRYTRRGIIREE